MNKLVAVVPIRKGSQRVKNKNFRTFVDKNLLIYKIETLKKLKFLDEIIINTDSEKAISLAKKLNVKFFRREDYYASSHCLNSDFWKNVADNTNSEYIMFTNCTSPLITLKTYENIISIFSDIYKTNEFDSINTVTEIKEFLFKDSKPINFKLNKTPNSQDLPNIVKLNFAINILKTKQMSSRKSLIGRKPFLYNLDEREGLDINTEYEFSFAEFLYKKQ
ncbi:cytidylyltransferase [Pelagibacterales bacterium SAG-MED22]|nr:cytidylyltransferase [Pelagibacterales bacterium SAG-MED22]